MPLLRSGPRLRRALALLACVAMLATVADAVPARAQDTTQIQVRLSRSLLSDVDVQAIFAELAENGPAGVEFTFTLEDTSPTECTQFVAALDQANERAETIGRRWDAENASVEQTVWQFSNAGRAKRAYRQVRAADLIACSKALADAAAQPGIQIEYTNVDVSDDPELTASWDFPGFASAAQLRATRQSDQAATEADRAAVWTLVDDTLMRTSLAAQDRDLFDGDELTPLGRSVVGHLVDVAVTNVDASDALHVGLLPVSGDPRVGIGECDVSVNGAVYDTLLRLRRNGGIAGGLADRWEVSEDGLAYTLTLRDDLQWSDGRPVVAADVVASLQATIPFSVNPTARRTTVEAIDDRTLRVDLAGPDGISVLWDFTGTVGVVAGTGPEPDALPLSAGGFQLSSFTPGVRAIAHREDPAPRGLPKTVVYEAVTGDPLDWLATVGNAIAPIAPEQIDGAEAAGFETRTAPTGSGVVMLFDLRSTQTTPAGDVQPIFDDARVRWAIAHAIDRASLVDDGLGGHGTVTDEPLGPGWGRTPRDDPLDYDPDLAQQLLDEAGWVRDGEVRVAMLDDVAGPATADLASTVRRNLADAGINAAVDLLDAQDMGVVVSAGGADLWVLPSLEGWDPLDTVTQFVSPGFPLAEYSGAVARLAGSELQQALAAARQELDRNQRYEEIEELFREDLPFIWLYTRDQAIAWDSELVRGAPSLGFRPCDPWDLANVDTR